MIYIDPNEIKNHPEITTKFEEYAIRNQNVDYIIGNCSIEVKWNLDDVYASVLDGRLFRQAQYLTENNGFFIIIQQSSYFFKKNYKKKIAVCDGAILSLIIDWRIPVLTLSTDGAFYSHLNKIANKLAKEKKDTEYTNFKKVGRSEKERHLGALAQIEGISVTKAKILFEEFKSLTQIITKKSTDFQKLKGFGPKLSKRIQDFFEWKN